MTNKKVQKQISIKNKIYKTEKMIISQKILHFYAKIRYKFTF